RTGASNRANMERGGSKSAQGRTIVKNAGQSKMRGPTMHRYCVLACIVIGGYCATLALITAYQKSAEAEGFLTGGLLLLPAALAFGLAAIATREPMKYAQGSREGSELSLTSPDLSIPSSKNPVT